MTQHRDVTKWAFKSLVVLGLWMVVALLISSITLLQEVQAGASVNLAGIFIYELVCLSPWIICTPAIIWLARKYRFEKDGIYISTFVHFTVALFIFCFHSLVQSTAVAYYFDQITLSWAYIQRDFWGFLDMRVILYIGMLLIVYAIDFQKKNRAIRLRKSKLKAELNKAKFHALLNQIQPDFLLKTIDAIDEKLDQDLEAAEEILTDFSDLLRIMLNSVSREEVIVQQDIEAYELYVSVLSKRLDTSIQKKIEIDPNCYQALIPSFLLLIPLFEQIIKVGSVKIESIGYKATQKENRIELAVNIRGDRIGIPELSKLYRKSGLPKIVKSLRVRYGEKVRFNTDSDDDLIHFGLELPFIIEGVSFSTAQ